MDGAPRGEPASSRILVYGPAAPFTEKVRRALGLKKLEHQWIQPESSEDYRRWNPETGLLPVADIGGERVADSTDIVMRIDALHPDPPLLSSDAKVAAAQQHLEDWCDEVFSWYWNRWRRVRDAGGDPDPPARPDDFSWLRPRTWFESLRPPASEAGPRDSAAFLGREMERRLADLDGWLADRPFFYADAPSIADLAVYATLWSLKLGGFPRAAEGIARRPRLVAFMRRVEGATGMPEGIDPDAQDAPQAPRVPSGASAAPRMSR